MFPRAHRPIRSPLSKRPLSLGLFREKKPPDVKVTVPSVHHINTFYPPLKLSSAVSARPKREKRRLPLFPEGDEWQGIKGGSGGDDAWVHGKYYLGTIPSKPPL